VSRGHNRERQVRKELEKEGWLVVRAGGSLGIADLVALKATKQPRIIEVKSDDVKFGPFNNFGPKRRAEFLAAAGHAGAEPLLAYWPPHGKLEYIAVDLWP
jgi:Holliday junction resolvase